MASAAKKADERLYRQTRQKLGEPSAWPCEARIPGICAGRATNYHHRLRRAQGGVSDESNLMAVCGSGTTGCHGYIHDHPRWARENGFLLRTGDDPAAVPVARLGRFA